MLNSDLKALLAKKDWDYHMFLENNYKSEAAKVFIGYRDFVDKLYDNNIIGKRKYNKYKKRFKKYLETCPDIQKLV